MSYDFNMLNLSPYINEEVGENLQDCWGKAFMYLENGTVTVANSGEKALGLAPINTENYISEGDRIDIAIAGIGLLRVSQEVKAGDILTIDANGCGKIATSGDGIFGRAMLPAQADSCTHVHLAPFGAKY